MQSNTRPVLTVETGNLDIESWITKMRREHEAGGHASHFYVTCPLCQAQTWRRP